MQSTQFWKWEKAKKNNYEANNHLWSMGTITDSACNIIISYAYFMDTLIFSNGMADTFFV